MIDSNSILAVCLIAIAKFQLATPPPGMVVSGYTRAINQDMEPRPTTIEYAIRETDVDGHRPFGMSASQFQWRILQQEIQLRRTALSNIRRFIKTNLSSLQGILRNALEDVQEEYEHQMVEIQASESNLREWINMMGTNKSVEMAEQSIRVSKKAIQESKRVKLCKPLESILDEAYSSDNLYTK